MDLRSVLIRSKFGSSGDPGKCICLKLQNVFVSNPSLVVEVIPDVGTDTWEGKDEERWDDGACPIWREIHLCIHAKYKYKCKPNTDIERNTFMHPRQI